MHPQRQARVARALKVFSVTAYVTGVFLLLLVAKMVYVYLIVGKENAPGWLDYFGIVHGLAYMAFILASLDLGTKARWEPVKWLTTMLAGVVPLLSFYVEKVRRNEVKETFALQ
ncbi:DUF3817 domain-containing protein [Corynebacterium heidelbergense]|uniref:DUF3817 domain-containing protein n=1 Tax=Corynebacterium heidelbergense TaxID=2055947 RepID=UPI002358F6D1|nr:DUF3817 domain-containing protein [Corynebacterium heidelbergense]